MAIRLSRPPHLATAMLLVVAASFLLPGCVSSSGKVQPLACPLELTSPHRAEPQMPDDAGMVQPSTPAERKATASFLTWLADYADWGREADARREAGATWCATKR